MVERLELNSYAKINLHLAVSSRRDDGFHSLVSFFHLISLHDKVMLEWQPSSFLQIECQMEGASFLETEKNIAYQAALLFLTQTKQKGICRIFIQKKIPMQAGLGGGSSNAATVLLGLNRLTGLGLKEEALLSLALSLGSDVPFFIRGVASLVEGRGEHLTPLTPSLFYPVVVVVPPFPISTKEAFACLDKAKRSAIDCAREKKRIEEERLLPPKQWSFYNSFQSIIEKQYPPMQRYREALLVEGASFASLSGSGSALFGIYEEAEKSRRASEKITLFPVKIYHEKLIANSPFME